MQPCAVPAGTNEQKAGLDLLRELVLTGRVITSDALDGQQETGELITDSGGHEVLPVKDHQPTLGPAPATGTIQRVVKHAAHHGGARWRLESPRAKLIR